MATNYTVYGSSYWRITGSYGTDENGKRLRKVFLGSNKKNADFKKKIFEHLIFRGLTFQEASSIFDETIFQNKLINQNIDLIEIDAYLQSRNSTKDDTVQSLETAMKSWLFDVKRVADNVKASSFERYEGLYRIYIIGWEYAQKPYDEIKSNDLQRHYNYLYEVEDKSNNIVKEINKLIKAFYNYEILQERIVRNPAAGRKISLPGASDQKKRTEIMSSEDLKKFIAALAGHRLEMLFIFSISTGMRIGEVIALKLDDVDLDQATIHVQATQYSCNVFDSEGNKQYKSIRNSTKNRLCRDIPLPLNIVPIFKEYLLRRKKHRLKLGSAFIEQGYVFPDMLGGPYNYANIRKAYVKLFETSGIPFKKIHSLRHSYASMLTENGAKITNIQELLGHTSIQTTQIYIHTSEESKRSDVNTLKII